MAAVNFLNLDHYNPEQILNLLTRAQNFKTGQDTTVFPNKIAANMFFEPSTRTQNSFTIAEEKLGMRVIFFNAEASSMKKGETFYDTVKTIDSLGVNAIVIRHSETEYYNELLGHINAPILNAGDGVGNHPTQALLDLLTIRQEFGELKGLKVGIIGDVVHSRVAHSDAAVMRRLGMEVATSGPEEFREEGMNYQPFEKVLTESDVVMLLRVQHERLAGSMQISKEDYHAQFGLTSARVAQMKKGAIIMHPAPFNRGVEIASDVVECAQSRIFKQMENGVYARMAVIASCLEAAEKECEKC